MDVQRSADTINSSRAIGAILAIVVVLESMLQLCLSNILINRQVNINSVHFVQSVRVLISEINNDSSERNMA